MKWLQRFALSLIAAAGFSGASYAEDLLILTEEVPVSLNYDGATASIDTNWVGWDNILDPLVYHANGGDHRVQAKDDIENRDREQHSAERVGPGVFGHGFLFVSLHFFVNLVG